MGKKNKDFGTLSVSDLKDQQRKLEKKIKQITIPCPHTKSNGKLCGKFIKGDLFKCDRCGEVFSFAQVSGQTLKDAVDTCTNVLNQIKAFSQDPKEDADLIKSLGEIAYNLGEVPELYSRTMNIDRKKKKNRNEDDDDFGGYGTLTFIGNKKKKKESKW